METGLCRGAGYVTITKRKQDQPQTKQPSTGPGETQTQGQTRGRRSLSTGMNALNLELLRRIL